MINKSYVYILAAILGILAVTNFKLGANDPKPAAGQVEEYVTIIYGGRHDSLIIRPGGKAEVQNLASVNFPERVNSSQEINYLMYLMIEKCAKEGYCVVDFDTPGFAVMKRRVAP